MTEKLYINNPYLKETHAIVVDKSFKDETFLIKLDRTIFFPHMAGAQPRDLGTIDNKEVIDTYEDGLDIVHVLNEDIDLENVSLSIDWNRRFELMQQHTGQHILSAAFKKLFNTDTIGSHLGEKHSTIDIELENISREEIVQIEILTNKIIQSNFKIRSYFLNPEDMDKSNSLEVPETDEAIRIVNIYNVSTETCCGTHLSSTGEVGLIKILNAEKSKGNIRISFICGNRALEDYRLKDNSLKEISFALSSNTSNTLTRFYKLQEAKEELQRHNKDLRGELIDLKGDILLEKKKVINGVNYIIENLKNIDKDDLNLLSSHLNKIENLIQVYKFIDGDYDSFLISKSDNLDIDLKELFNLINEKNIIKGGGNKNLVQGTTSLDLIDRVLEEFFTKIQQHFKD